MTKARPDRVGKIGLAVVRTIVAQEICDNRTRRQPIDRVEQDIASFGRQKPTDEAKSQPAG
jgi:hypothetical protein